MNYVELHLGDWAKAVAHLTPVEEGVYLRLLRRYYADEAPLPADVTACQRLAGARTLDEREAVVVVLAEFFTLEADGHRNKRADEEIERMYAKKAKAAASARARWDARAPSEDVQRSPVASNTDCESDASGMRSHSEGNALQSPVTKQEQDQKLSASKSPKKSKRQLAAEYPLPDWIDRALWVKWIDGRTKPAAGLDENIAKLEGWRKKGHDPAAILREAIAGGWQGLYLPKSPGAPHDHHGSSSRPSVVERIRQNIERGERERAQLTVIEGTHVRRA